jgi:hypothetical protein
MDEIRKSVDMKKLIPVLIILMFTGNMLAQDNRPGFEKYLEKFKSEKIAFITEKMDLTVEEAQKFWPLYNEYQGKRDELIKSRRLEYGRNNQDMTSEELEQMVDSRIEEELKLAEMKLEFHKEVKKVIPIEKVVKLYRAENEFMNHMLNRIRQQDGPGRRGRHMQQDRQ